MMRKEITLLKCNNAYAEVPSHMNSLTIMLVMQQYSTALCWLVVYVLDRIAVAAGHNQPQITEYKLVNLSLTS